MPIEGDDYSRYRKQNLPVASQHRNLLSHVVNALLEIESRTSAVDKIESRSVSDVGNSTCVPQSPTPNTAASPVVAEDAGDYSRRSSTGFRFLDDISRRVGEALDSMLMPTDAQLSSFMLQLFSLDDEGALWGNESEVDEGDLTDNLEYSEGSCSRIEDGEGDLFDYDADDVQSGFPFRLTSIVSQLNTFEGIKPLWKCITRREIVKQCDWRVTALNCI